MRKGRPQVALILTAEKRQRLNRLRIGRDQPRRRRGGLTARAWRAFTARNMAVSA